MMNYIWGIMILLSVIIGIISGNANKLSDSVLSGAKSAVELIISMTGMMCLWSGLMNVAEQGGVTKSLARFFSPVLKRLFPEYKNDEKTSSAICSNVTANLLGLGNAATPLGLRAMKRMNEANPNKTVANNSMVMFVVINTASIQLIPTTITILRSEAGAAIPMDIVPCVWISSAVALIVGIIMAKLFSGRGNKI